MSSGFNPEAVRRKILEQGEDAILQAFHTYSASAREYYYQMIKEIRAERQESERTELQREANKLTKSALITARIAIAFSILACLVSATATIYAALLASR